MTIHPERTIGELVAHHYRNDGGEMTHQEQLEDSVNIEGGRLTELFFPLNGDTGSTQAAPV